MVAGARCVLPPSLGHPAVAQLGRDLFVEQPRDGQPKHVALAGRQRGKTPVQFCQLRTLRACHTVTLQGLLDGVEQFLVAEGFGEKLHRSGLHGVHRRRNVAVARDEDNGEVDLGGGQLALNQST
jgi:hypothetical protein